MNIHTANSHSARPEATTGERVRRPKPVRFPGRRPQDVRRWLEQQPSLDELSEVFPAEWRDAQHDVADILANQHHDGAEDAIARLQAPMRRNASSPGMRDEQQLLVSSLVRRHMVTALLRQVVLSKAAGVTEGRIRFNHLNGYVAQKLLFQRGLERKPVSMRWFRLVWPFLWQRQLLMPLVQPKGIYCFYSKPLIQELATLIGQRSCLEIAAGDGTLSRFLAAKGVDITATDDHSWAQSVTYGPTVIRKDAVAALRQYQPQVVICSWPPARNTFEREVFRTPSVELYVVIGSQHRASAGNWHDYARQSTFSFQERTKLSRLLLPPELDGAVYTFERIAAR